MSAPTYRQAAEETAATVFTEVLPGEPIFSANKQAPPHGAILSKLYRISTWCAPLVLIISDYLMVVAGLLAALLLKNLSFGHTGQTAAEMDHFNTYIFLIFPLIYLGLLAYGGMYHKRLPLWLKLEQLARIGFFAALLGIGVLFFSQEAHFASRLWIAFSLLTCFITLVTGRFWIKHLLVAGGLWQKPVILIGSGRGAQAVAEAYEEDRYLGYRIVGIISDDAWSPFVKRYPYLGPVSQAPQLLAANGNAEVIVALPGIQRDKLLDLVYRLQPQVRKLAIIHDLFGLPLNKIEVDTFFKQKTVLLRVENSLLNPWNWGIKRIFDLVGGGLGFLLCLPLLLIIGLIIKVDSPGPVLHSARRIGKNGREFYCHKFRSMFVNSDSRLDDYLQSNLAAKAEWERFAKLRAHDPRVTRFGKLLRRFSLDELPQLINILKGEMSLVGPRPYLPREREKMVNHHTTIIQTVPGITGLWQVSGRNALDFEERLDLDVWYVRNWSFWIDVTLLLKTVKVVLRRSGAY